MELLDWSLSFGQILFPIFLLVPTLISSLKNLIQRDQLIAFFVLMWSHYALLFILSIINSDRSWGLFLTMISMIIGYFALHLVMKWTLDEQISLEVQLRDMHPNNEGES